MPASPHTGIYVGSFDPITRGHLDVLARARRLFDRIVVGIGHNPEKIAVFTLEERTDMVRILVDDLLAEAPDGAPVEVMSYQGLTVDLAKDTGACAIIRGIRNITDLAEETQLAITNRQIADVETVFIVTGEAYAFTSSSLIRQIAAHGGSLDRLEHLVPPVVIQRMKDKVIDPDSLLSTLRPR